MFQIRRACLEDMNDLNRIMRVSKGYWGYDEIFLDKFMAVHGVTEICIRDIHIYCVYINTVLGAFFGFKLDEEGQHELDLFFLDTPFIGKGLGRQLWKTALNTAEEISISEFRTRCRTPRQGLLFENGLYADLLKTLNDTPHPKHSHHALHFQKLT